MCTVGHAACSVNSKEQHSELYQPHSVVVHIHFPQAPHHVQLVACPISLTILLVIPALQGHSFCLRG